MTHSAYDHGKVALIQHLQELNLSDEQINLTVLLAIEMAEGKRIDFLNDIHKMDSNFRNKLNNEIGKK